MKRNEFECYGKKAVILTDLENNKILVEYDGKNQWFNYTEELDKRLPGEIIYELKEKYFCDSNQKNVELDEINKPVVEELVKNSNSAIENNEDKVINTSPDIENEEKPTYSKKDFGFGINLIFSMFLIAIIIANMLVTNFLFYIAHIEKKYKQEIAEDYNELDELSVIPPITYSQDQWISDQFKSEE